MASWQWKNKRSLNIAMHRDFGYFFSSLIVIYCLSGIALNHVDDWNPDFIITKDSVSVQKTYTMTEVTHDVILDFSKQVGETDYKVFDFPTKNQVKIYYDNASLHLNLSTGKGIYENVSRRPVFYEANVIHRNSLKGWKWAADVFAVMLIAINITGLFILKGKYGLSGRGKWLIAAGAIPPIAAILLMEFIQ
ncbi:MAG TPA: PepSY-associated TM helix domain-containing protein [Bacteroidia bacterium]|nr:PepSY-associated TM helix domain-containing protein [Bacteroidia bacterium]